MASISRAGPNQEPRASLGLPYGGWDPCTQAIFYHFLQEHQQGSGSEMEQPQLKLVPIHSAACSFTCYTHHWSLQFFNQCAFLVISDELRKVVMSFFVFCRWGWFWDCSWLNCALEAVLKPQAVTHRGLSCGLWTPALASLLLRWDFFLLCCEMNSCDVDSESITSPGSSYLTRLLWIPSVRHKACSD